MIGLTFTAKNLAIPLRSNIDRKPEMAYTTIMTISIEIIRDGVFDLLSSMERLGLIKVNTPVHNAVLDKKLSERFAGALHLSDDEYEAYQKSLEKSRSEWTRNIY